MRFHTILLVAGALVFSGCATSRICTRNEKAAQRLSFLFIVWDNFVDSGWYYPTTLEDLSKELHAFGVQERLPQCECADGQFRDFVYVPGFTGTDVECAFLFSPPQMAGDKVVVAYIDTTTKVMSRDEAKKEMEKSYTFKKDRTR